MADVKISGLPASSVPLAGTEVLPIVQGGQTRQVSVNNLTTGKAVSATQYTSTITTGTAPLVVASTTEVANLRAANATSADTANQVKSNATTGVLQVAGPGTGTTRVMTTPDANFSVARKDAAQTFTGDQTFSGDVTANTFIATGAVSAQPTNGGVQLGTSATFGLLLIGKGSTNNISILNSAGSIALGQPTGTSNIEIPAGNLVIGTSGNGIDFSATAGTGTSELLADYEEGTFTPTLGGSATYFAQNGKYTKIGRVVYFSIVLVVDSIGTGSTTTISGLPFSAAASTEQGISIVYFNALATSIVNIVGTVDSGTTVVLRSLTAAGTTLGTSALFGNFADIRMTGFYFT